MGEDRKRDHVEVHRGDITRISEHQFLPRLFLGFEGVLVGDCFAVGGVVVGGLIVGGFEEGGLAVTVLTVLVVTGLSTAGVTGG